MPIKYLNRNNVSVSAGNSVQFNGSSQYLSIPNNAAFNLSGAFTMECWIYFTSTPPLNSSNEPGVTLARYGIPNKTNQGWEFDATVGASGYISFSKTGTANRFVANYANFALNTWYHVAAVYNGSAGTIYLNGTALTSNNNTWSWTAPSGGTPLMTIGALLLYAGYNNYFPGYVSNFRIVNGTALYTSNFTPSTTPLTAIANTVLLTCNAATIVDSSTNNFTITNNGSATVSSTVPFTALPKGIAFKNRNNVVASVGNSVLFNGSNQYLTVGAASNWTFLSNGSSWTAECWFNVPSASLSKQYTLVSTNAGSLNVGMNFSLNNTTAGDVRAVVYKGISGQTALNVTANSGSFTPNTWNHVAAVYNSGTSTGTIYINGVAIVSAAGSGFNTGTPTYTLAIGRYQFSTPAGYLDGYISNLRITNSALYTSNFTPPTSPLTAIANTSLLTCNAATIIDGSTNNFAITNNGGATVSSTIPFTAISSPSTIKLNKVYADPIVVYLTQKAIFGYGNFGSNLSTTNLVSNTGVVATDTAGVGTARILLAAAGYGNDKAIFGYGSNGSNTNYSMTNKVNNTGVVATDTTGVGTARYILAAANYGGDKAIFGYGYTTVKVSMTNLVSNTGVVASDTTGVGTERIGLAAAGYGRNGKAIFGYGENSSNANVSITNLVSDTGVVASDTTGVGTERIGLAAAGYGTDKAIFGYGWLGFSPWVTSITNLVSNTGVVATDTTGVGQIRAYLGAASYGGDKAIFGYGNNGSQGRPYAKTNLVSNTGVVATDTAGVGTDRGQLAAAGYSLT